MADSTEIEPRGEVFRMTVIWGGDDDREPELDSEPPITRRERVYTWVHLYVVLVIIGSLSTAVARKVTADAERAIADYRDGGVPAVKPQ